MKKIFFIFLIALSHQSYAQFGANDIDVSDDDLNVGSDIFSDFTEELDSTQSMEDERYFKYGRLYHLDFSVGTTTFSGNRGAAYKDDPPTWGFSVHYFMDFQSSFGLGVEYSSHHMDIDYKTDNWDPIGRVDIGLLRAFFAYRYYLDTTNLGTAITYSNPYFVGRFEYWYMKQTFTEQDNQDALPKKGGIGLALGAGLEFPIKMKESYLGLEFLVHSVAFPDKYTSLWQPRTGETALGYRDLTGMGYTMKLSYVWNW